MILHGEPRENDPAGGILDESLRPVDRVLLRILHIDGLIAVVDAGGGAEEDRRAPFFGEIEGLLDHIVGFGDRGGIEDRHLREHTEGPGVLLGLGGNGPGVIRDHDHHSAFHADIFQAHERVGGHVKAHLLHGHEGPCARIGGAGGHFHAGLLVDGPLHVDIARIPLRDGLQHLRGGRSGIAGHQIDPGGDGPESDGFISHQEFFVHRFLFSYISGAMNFIRLPRIFTESFSRRMVSRETVRHFFRVSR